MNEDMGTEDPQAELDRLRAQNEDLQQRLIAQGCELLRYQKIIVSIAHCVTREACQLVTGAAQVADDGSAVPVAREDSQPSRPFVISSQPRARA